MLEVKAENTRCYQPCSVARFVIQHLFGGSDSKYPWQFKRECLVMVAEIVIHLLIGATGLAVPLCLYRGQHDGLKSMTHDFLFFQNHFFPFVQNSFFWHFTIKWPIDGSIPTNRSTTSAVWRSGYLVFAAAVFKRAVSEEAPWGVAGWRVWQWSIHSDVSV